MADDNRDAHLALNVKLRRHFGWNNVASLFPLVLQWFKAPHIFQQLGPAAEPPFLVSV